MPAVLGRNRSSLRVLLPLNPSANAIAPSSPQLILVTRRTSNECASDCNSGDNDLIPAAVINGLSLRYIVSRLRQFIMPSAKACSPLSSIALVSI
ncbi:hypothetical protein ACHAWC_006260 [Mediolabrus comicus]